MVVVVTEQNTPVVWLDTDGRHDIRSGSDVVTPLSTTETADLIRSRIAAGIADLQAALLAAQAQITAATARATAAASIRDGETTRAAAVRATTPAATLAYVTAIRDELALIHDKLALSAGAIADLSSETARAAQGIALAYDDLIGLARIVADAL